MKKLSIILMCLLCFAAQCFAHTAEERAQIEREYYFTEAVNVAAALCIGIYDPDEAPEIVYLRDYGWGIVPFDLKAGKIDSSIVVAKNYIAEQDLDFYIIGFRGAANKGDWKISLSTEKVPYGGSNLEEFISTSAKDGDEEKQPMVHKGFNEYVNAVLSAMLQEGSDGKKLIDELKTNPKVRVLLTGHSLGGAVATLTAERLVSMGIDKTRVPVITFGAPAIGNRHFAEQYGDKILLWRVTNTADPVPGSLQTFFGGYVQFGQQCKYSVSPKMALKQHDMAMYFDVSVHNYNKALAKAQQIGLAAPLPMQCTEGDAPLVAVWVGASRNLQKRTYLPDIKQFLVHEYTNMLPRYVIMDDDIKLYEYDLYPLRSFCRDAQALGADYVLIAEIDGHQPQNSDNWYINMNQSIFDAQGRLLNVVSVSKLVSPYSGNMHAAVYAVKEARAQLKSCLPWISTESAKEPRWVRLGEEAK